jgi:hypothetical protein
MARQTYNMLLWLLLLVSISEAYFDAGDATLPPLREPTVSISHHILQAEWPQATQRYGSMILEVAPLITQRAEMDEEMLYSMHLRHGAPERRTRMGQGVFKRGVFASDPPFPTCKKCGGVDNGGVSGTSVFTSRFSTAPECKTIPYNVR